jgi:hypothetical protein
MGAGSLFSLSRTLSLLAEVVRMLFDGLGKKGKPTGRPSGRAPSAGSPLPRRRLNADCRGAAVLGSLGFRQRNRAQSACHVGRFGSLGAPKGAPKVDLTTQFRNKSDAAA